MSTRKIVAVFFLFDFVLLNLVAFYQEGIMGLFDFILSIENIWGYVLVADLLIALGMLSVWMYNDAKKRGKNPIIYFLLLLLGSIGPLCYAIFNGETNGKPTRWV